MLRVTNSTIYDRITTQLAQQQTRLALTQEKLTTGRNFLRPSDAPDQVAALDRLESSVRETEQFTSNVERIKDKLNFQELSINSIHEELIRAKELLIQGANGTMDANLRLSMAIELESIYESVAAIGNQKDIDGSYLFGGYKQDNPPFDVNANPLDPNIGFNGMYKGDDEVQVIGIDRSYMLSVGMPGSQLFSGFEDSSGNKTDLFSSLKKAINAFKSNDLGEIQNSIDAVGNASTHVNIKLTQIGSRMKVVENQLTVLSDRSATLESTISQVEDLDYVSAITDLKNQSLALQAGQQSFAQISNLSLFNYIR